MRKEFEKIVGKELRCLAIETRDLLALTQKEMGELLEMGESSYSDIETGETICASTLTTILLLIVQNDPNAFLNRVASHIKERRGLI